MTEPKFVGVDFGTTNSALALAGRDGGSSLVSLTQKGEPTFRSILYLMQMNTGLTANL